MKKGAFLSDRIFFIRSSRMKVPKQTNSNKKRGAPYGNQNALGNKGGGAPKGNQNAKGHGAPKGNENAITFGFFAYGAVRRMYEEYFEWGNNKEDL